MKTLDINKEIYNYAEIKILTEGLKNLNITKMCSDLGLSKKTFYKKFELKETFIKKFYFEKLSSAYIQLIEVIQKQDTFADKILSISHLVEKFIPFFNNNSMKEIGKEYPTVIRQINVFKYNRVLPLFNLVIKTGQKHKIINEYNPTIMLKVFFSVMSGIYESQITKQNKGNIEFNDAFQILANGILTKKGKNFLNNKLVNIN